MGEASGTPVTSEQWAIDLRSLATQLQGTEPWSYVGDVIVGVAIGCNHKSPRIQPGPGLVMTSEYRHESHDLIPPRTEDELSNLDLPWEEYQAACKFVAIASPDAITRLMTYCDQYYEQTQVMAMLILQLEGEVARLKSLSR